MANNLTQSFTLQLRPCCPGHGVYLRWISPLNDWPAWLFDGDVDDTTDVAAGTVFRPEQGPAQLLRRGAMDKQLLRAGNLTPAQHATLTTLLISPQVYIQDLYGRLTPVLVTAAQPGRTSSDNRTTFDVEVDVATRNPLTRI
ncbi:hypothetical protein [Hymenobacter cellulosilyticus]|uniref:Uncharacterized protein n=1 Tax=Hymenobacter cellulosilyticus TaxID=2932248 RepID=A0A8T9PZR3_9BACT|nr:hypothetical protein [Hymenobacter cellulosilyticus]UOQ70976.1 hypothetical protein MUN79_20195 [Hymenobacter cellulosilyticus]